MKKGAVAFLLIIVLVFILLISQNVEDKKITREQYLKEDFSNQREISETIYNSQENSIIAQTENLNLDFKNTHYIEKFIEMKTEKDFNLERISYEKNKKTSMEFIYYQQNYDGIPVYGSYFNVFKKNDKIVKITYNLHDTPSISTEPGISREESIKISVEDSGNDKILESGLIIYKNRLCWRILNSRELYIIDAENSDILMKESTVREANVYGTVTGSYYPHDSSQSLENSTFEDENVTAANSSGFSADSTDESGFYNLTMEGDNLTVVSYLSGDYVNVLNDKQTRVSYNESRASGENNWSWFNIDNSSNFEESNIFYHVNKIHDFFKKGSPFNLTHIDYSINATVQYNLINEGFGNNCNAYYSGSQGTGVIVFGNGSGVSGCSNLALGSDIIYHEYAHMIVDGVYGSTSLPYTLQTGAMNEAWADYYACTLNNDPGLGDNVFPSSSARYLNNSDIYPDDWVWEVHYDSTSVSGAFWEIRTILGNETTDGLVLDAMKMKPQSFTEILEDMLIVDDDNADLTDGTPNSSYICSAFNNHGIVSEYCYLYDSVIYSDYSNNTLVEIPDNGSWVNLKIEIPNNERRNITDVDFYINITHAFAPDLIVKIIEPNGTQIILYEGSYWNSGENIQKWYDSELPPDGSDGNSPELLNSLDGSFSNGTWYVNVSDNAISDNGTINSFKIRVYYVLEDFSPSVILNSPQDYNVSSFSDIILNCTSYDDFNVTNMSLYGNWSGWHANQSNSSPYNNSYTNFSSNLSEGIYVWNCYACDNSSNCAFASSNRTFSIDKTGPTSSNNSTNSTYAGQIIKHNLGWRDNVALTGYIFSFDNGNGTFVNESFVSMTGTANWSNVTKTINSTIGSTIQWKVYANDSANNWNVSSSYAYNATGPPNITATLISPSDTQQINRASFPTSQQFNWSATDKINNTMNCSLYLDSIYKESAECTNNTVCSITLENLGQKSYSWQINCSDYENNTGASEEYTFTLSQQSNVVGGGGGTSGNLGNATLLNQTEQNWSSSSIKNLGNIATIEGISGIRLKGLIKGIVIYFKINDAGHSASILNVSNNSVYVEVSSESERAHISEMDSHDFDLDHDGKDDFRIRVDSIVDKVAVMTLFYLENPVYTETAGSNEENIRENLSVPFEWAYLLLGLIAVVLIVMIIFFSRKMK